MSTDSLMTDVRPISVQGDYALEARGLWRIKGEMCIRDRYYTFTDAQKILVGFLSQIKDRNSADYKKYFDELRCV